MKVLALFSLILLTSLIGIILKITLDIYPGVVYPPVHQHACIGVKDGEAWQQVVGRVESVGSRHVLLTLGRDASIVPFKAHVHGFTFSFSEFHTLFKEVPCPSK